MLLAFEYVPGEHIVQKAMAAYGATCPASHGKHTSEPYSALVPGGQASQPELEMTVPGAHGAQLLDAGSSAVRHRSHVSEPLALA